MFEVAGWVLVSMLLIACAGASARSVLGRTLVSTPQNAFWDALGYAALAAWMIIALYRV